MKHRFHRHQSSSSIHGSFNHNHVQDTNLPLVAEEHDEHNDKGPVYDPKQDVFVSLFVSFLFDVLNSTGFFSLPSLFLSAADRDMIDCAAVETLPAGSTVNAIYQSQS